MARKPVVALVGRPNVGKSTLFNRLSGTRDAIVDDIPGTTRDRLFGHAEWCGTEFDIIDTGGIDPETAGQKTPLSVGSADFISEIKTQAILAVEEADVVLFLTDASTGVTTADREIAQILRRMQKTVDGVRTPPVLLVVNKADSDKLRANVPEFYELGMGDPYPISAIHGTETGDLLDALCALFPKQEEEEEDDSVKIAIVGRPNVGKSSLLNRLCGEERVIVSNIPGTTRDAIDTKLMVDDVPVTLVDTAGIRRKGKVEAGVEKYSVIRSMRVIEEADVSLLVIDATQGVSMQEAHIAGYILEAWKSVVVVVNKWDAIEKDTYTMQQFTEKIRKDLNFMDYVPILFVSAKTGQRTNQILSTALQVQEQRLVRIPTSALNDAIHEAQDKHHATSKSGRSLQMYYATQVRSDPPTFMIYVNDPDLAHFTYKRYLENQLRERFGFVGTPIRFVFKARR